MVTVTIGGVAGIDGEGPVIPKLLQTTGIVLHNQSASHILHGFQISWLTFK